MLNQAKMSTELVWVFNTRNVKKCLIFDNKGCMGTFLWPLKGQILTYKDWKVINFQSHSDNINVNMIQSIVYESFWDH